MVASVAFLLRWLLILELLWLLVKVTMRLRVLNGAAPSQVTVTCFIKLLFKLLVLESVGGVFRVAGSAVTISRKWSGRDFPG